ncbi:MAG: hypothetical protein P4M05_28250 [Bradyrhizobium sp.]|nr:hypothetical protein [Bradyrhizobium sp.]
MTGGCVLLIDDPIAPDGSVISIPGCTLIIDGVRYCCGVDGVTIEGTNDVLDLDTNAMVAALRLNGISGPLRVVWPEPASRPPRPTSPSARKKARKA